MILHLLRDGGRGELSFSQVDQDTVLYSASGPRAGLVVPCPRPPGLLRSLPRHRLGGAHAQQAHFRGGRLLLSFAGRREHVHSPLQLVHDAPHVLVAGVRDGLHPRLHVFIVVGHHHVDPRPLPVERDFKGVLGHGGQLYATRFQHYQPKRLLVLLLLKVEEKVALQYEPSSLVALVEVSALAQVAFFVDGRRAGGETGHVLLVEFHPSLRTAAVKRSPSPDRSYLELAS